jgi:phosphoribosyl 1,2-cyclic phosphodiesterase
MNENPSMVIKYWGVRGSIPAPLTAEQIREKEIALIEKIIQDGGTDKFAGDRSKIKEYLETLPLSLSGTYGGDTTCLEIQAKDSPLIMIDAGTGARALGNAILGRLFTGKNFNPLNSDEDTKKQIHLFFTHYHWDHIQGFPFFGPGFIPGVNIHFYGKKDATQELSDVLKGQQQYPNFPVEWVDMPCDKTYHELGRLSPVSMNVGKVKVNYQELTHPDSVFAYSIEVDGKKFVCATDTEHKDSPDPRLIKIAKNADILYYDSQYTPEEYCNPKMPKFDWGHSTFEWAIRNAFAADVKTVVLGHHDPPRDDFKADELYKRALAFRDMQLKEGKQLEVVMAYQGLEQRL